MDSGVNETDFVRQLSLDEKKEPPTRSSSKFPVVPVAVSTCVFVTLLLLAVFIGLYFVRRRRKQERYKQYSPVSKDPIRPEDNVDTRKQKQSLGHDTLELPNKASSDDSLTPISSDDSYYDALDNHSGGESISSREPSPLFPGKPESYIGKLWFSVAYDCNSECLTLILRKAADLPDRSSTVKTCDPLVKISLLPGNKHVAQSRYKRKNKNPIFNETFEVDIPSYEVNKSTLCMTVLDGYRANQQTVIGHVYYSLSHLSKTEATEVESEITKPTQSTSDLGQLHVSLSYYPTLHRLTAIVLRATNLPKLSHRQTDSFVKVSFSIGNKIMKTKKTVVHTDSTSPMYSEAFNFTVNEDDLGTSTLLISVMHSGGGVEENKLIGRILLGGRMYARGRACDHWIDMMASPRKMTKCWHELQR